MALLGLWPAATGAQETAAEIESQEIASRERIGVEDVVRRALEANPTLAVAEQRWAAGRAAPERVRDLPDPKLRTGVYAVPLDTLDLLQGQLRVQYMQEFPYPGTLERRGRVAVREAERLGHENRTARVGVAAAARRAYWDLYFAHRARAIHHDHLGLVRELSDSAEELYSTGQVPQENVLRALVELTELFSQLADVEARVAVAGVRLNVVLHRPPDAELGVPRPPPSHWEVPPLADLLEVAVQESPRLAAAAAAVDREEARIELERHEAKPDFGLMGEWWTASDGMGGRFERYAVLATVSLPWIHDDKYTAAVDEALAGRRAAEAERARLLDEIGGEVATARERLRAAMRIAELYRTSVLPQSEQSLQAARSTYEAGTADFVTLIDNERTLLANRLALARAEADVGAAWADLLEAVGVVEASEIAGVGEPAGGGRPLPSGASGAREAASDLASTSRDSRRSGGRGGER